jgi:hypothetical protein
MTAIGKGRTGSLPKPSTIGILNNVWRQTQRESLRKILIIKDKDTTFAKRKHKKYD